MKGKRVFRAFKIAIFVVAVVAILGFVVMHLWNSLMPAVFGIRLITYWQAVGLMILARLLFGGFRPGRGGMRWRRQMVERWEQMTPEEREKFREGMRGRCGQPHIPSAQPNP